MLSLTPLLLVISVPVHLLCKTAARKTQVLSIQFGPDLTLTCEKEKAGKDSQTYAKLRVSWNTTVVFFFILRARLFFSFLKDYFKSVIILECGLGKKKKKATSKQLLYYPEDVLKTTSSKIKAYPLGSLRLALHQGWLSFTYNLCRLGDLTWEMPQLRTAGNAMPFHKQRSERGVLFLFHPLCHSP